MDFDDPLRLMAEFRKCLSECAAGSAMTPEDVRWVACEKVAVQVPRAARGKSVERITWIGSRETFGPIAPAEEAHRHVPDDGSRPQHAQQEIVVFRPFPIAIAKGREAFPTNHQGWMGDRALDEAFAPEALRIAERMKPAFVRATPVCQRLPWKDSDEATDRLELRGSVEGFALSGEALAMHPIIAIHSCDERGATRLQPDVESRNQSLVRSAEEFYS